MGGEIDISPQSSLLTLWSLFFSFCIFIPTQLSTFSPLFLCPSLKHVKMKVLVAQLCPTLCDLMHYMQSSRHLCPWDSPGKNTGVSGHSLLLGIFPTQGSNPGLLPCR